MKIEPVTNRTNFTPTLFGKRLFMAGENLVYTIATDMCKDYTGGYWEYVSNATKTVMYMHPKTDDKFTVSAQNYYQGTMGAEAFGIVCTLYALNHLMFPPLPEPVLENLVEKFYALRDFAATHEEADEIFAAID